MACACKVNEEINKIHKYYSYGGEKRSKDGPKMEIDRKGAATALLAYILLLPLFPIVFIYLLFFSVFSKDKKISMKKLFNFIHKTKNGRKQ